MFHLTNMSFFKIHNLKLKLILIVIIQCKKECLKKTENAKLFSFFHLFIVAVEGKIIYLFKKTNKIKQHTDYYIDILEVYVIIYNHMSKALLQHLHMQVSKKSQSPKSKPL